MTELMAVSLMVPKPTALPFSSLAPAAWIPASRGQEGPHSLVKQGDSGGKGEPHPHGRPGFQDSPGGAEALQVHILTSPRREGAAASEKIILNVRPRSQNKLTQSHQRPGPPDF